MPMFRKINEAGQAVDNFVSSADTELQQTAAFIRARHNDMVEAVILTCIVIVVGVTVITWAAVEANR